MTITARFMLENPDASLATMKITMTIGEWVELRDQLKSMYPSWKLSSAITQLVTEARKVFHAEHGDAGATP